MNYPELLILIPIIIANYYLSVIGILIYRKGYGKHIIVESLELNPHWISSISQVRWINYKYIFATLIVNFTSIALIEIIKPVRAWYEFLLGFALITFILPIGNNVSNIFTYLYLRKKQNSIKGQVRIPHHVRIRISQNNIFISFFPFLVACVFHPSMFMYGGLMAMCVSFFTRGKYSKVKRRECGPT